MYKKEKAENLKNNLKYLIKSRGETQISLCNASGLTRTTIYNILEGKVANVQQSTIRRISDFFGVSYSEIETIDFEKKEVIEASVSLQGNMNPAAVPVIKESLIAHCFDKRIGELTVTQPLTYYFGMSSNLIGILLEHKIPGFNEPGDLLIVQRGVVGSDKEKLIYDRKTHKLSISTDLTFDGDFFHVVGEVIEERFNG